MSATRINTIPFQTPIYRSRTISDEVIFEDDVELRNYNDSSDEPVSPHRRRLPSLAARDVRRRFSETSKRKESGSSRSVSSSIVIEHTEDDIKTAHRLGNGRETPERSNGFKDSVETADVLTNFAPIAVEHFIKEREREREERLIKYRGLEASVKEQLRCLKMQHSISHSSAPSIYSRFARKRKTPDPIDLKSLARLHFPLRAEVKVYITDFKKNHTVEYDCRLSQITKYIDSKEEDVQIRWIHAPLGLGPLNSTIEELFLIRGPKGRPFNNTGRIGFPYVMMEVLNFCDSTRFQQMRDVYHFLHDDRDLTNELEKECWTGFEPSSKTKGKGVLDDLKWRTSWLGLAHDWETLPDFWTTSNSDVPCQLTEGLTMLNYGPLDGLQPTLWQSDRQALHRHRFFNSAQLVRDIFRCFHRGDGFLLTISPMRGVNYLDRNFRRHMEEPRDAIFENDVASAIAFVRRQFRGSGTQKWHQVTVEWLLIHLMTEIGITPHADHQGYNAPTLEGAYEECIQQFKRRREDHFSRNSQYEPAELIQDMLVCKEELRRILLISKRVQHVFENLAKDVEVFDAEDLRLSKKPEHPDRTAAATKVQIASQQAQLRCEAFERLLGDICMSLDEVYELRAIQQRQLGIITNGQNRALFLIATISAVFVPFSTLTGYWGMNLTDLRDSTWDQRRFWHFCASIAASAAILCFAVALSRYLYDKVMTRKNEQEEAQPRVTGPANKRLDTNSV